MRTIGTAQKYMTCDGDIYGQKYDMRLKKKNLCHAPRQRDVSYLPVLL